MNYRHAFHAGNFADVFKHAALALLLQHLGKKDKPFVVIDTHAGIGRYDLKGEEARKTGEAAQGIQRLAAGGPLDGPLAPFAAVLAGLNDSLADIRFYPGSPLIAQGMMRATDRLVAVERHPEDGLALRREMSADSRIEVRVADGYAALKALLPPRERRGLVFVDPPFEDEDERRKATRAIRDGVDRWATGLFVLWFPIKEPEMTERLLAEMTLLARPVLCAEFLLRSPQGGRLDGAGLVIVNPPWRMDQALRDLIGLLGDRLGARGPSGVRWVKTE